MRSATDESLEGVATDRRRGLQWGLLTAGKNADIETY